MDNQVRYTVTANDLLSGKLQGMNSQAKALEGTMGGLGKLASTMFAGFSAVYLVNEITNTLATFEKFEAVLTNTLGSNSEAQKALSDITEFASKTPFEVDKLTDAYVRLANQGFKPSMDELGNLGDLASSKGKDITQLSEALIDAQVGEFERLKEFGVRAKKNGDDITFTFKGQAKTVKMTDDAVKDYVLSLGDLQGVTGSMAAISETTGGKLSNLKDGFTQMFLVIGKSLKPVIDAVLDSTLEFTKVIKDFIGFLKEHKDIIIAIGSAYLTYKGMVIAQIALSKLSVLSFMSETFAVGMLTAGFGGASSAGMVLAGVMAVINAINPLVWVAVAIGAIVLLYNKFQWFRAFVNGFWESIKAYFDLIIQYFKGIYHIIVGLFTGDWSEVKDGFNSLADIAMNGGKKVGEAYRNGYNSKVKKENIATLREFQEANVKKINEGNFKNVEEYNKKVAGFKAVLDKNVKSGLINNATEKAILGKLTGFRKPTDLGGGLPKGNALSMASGKDKTKDVSGSKVVTINVSIGNLINDFKIQTTNIQESTNAIKEKVVMALTSAVNDSQLVAGQ